MSIEYKARPAYACGKCGEVHDHIDEAEDCCRPRVVDLWKCAICGEDYPKESEAMACFDDCESSGKEPPQPSDLVIPELPATANVFEYVAKFNELNHLTGARP